MPHYRSIVVVDVEGSTTRTNPAKARFRDVLYDLLDRALDRTGITPEHRDPPIDRGDGAILLIHPADHVPKTKLLTTLLPELAGLLTDHNHRTTDGVRLRAAVHAGEVHHDEKGAFGEAVDLACRLLDAPELKAALHHATTPLVTVVSDDIHHSIVRHRYEGIDALTFKPLIHLHLAGKPHRGWIHAHHVPTTDAVRFLTFPTAG
ncbi:hypothetical protein [Umezawaea sp. NPDC059074]|uniref:hypothetical protein n=1 Tax=Umezawaea sp. NPDC059074 TaxID=3346716 RepID=UPI0036BCE037